MEEQVVKRGPGRPKKPIMQPETNNPVDNSAKSSSKFKMKAKPNWEDIDHDMIDSPDRLHIDSSMIPEGMDLLWVTDSVLGENMAQHRSRFERRGWTPVHGLDFDGQFDGVWTPKGHDGEILSEGLVLMARPIEMSRKAKREDHRRAVEQVQVKERAVTGGDLNTPLDSRHPSALNSNRIRKSYERISVPEE